MIEGAGEIPDEILLGVARRVVWFQPPQETLQDEVQFLSHVMIYGLPEDVVAVRDAYGDEAFRNTLRNAWPGIFDPRSWFYWHTVLDMLPVPPLPVRRFPVAPGEPPLEVHPSLQGHGGPPRGRRYSTSAGMVPRPPPGGSAAV